MPMDKLDIIPANVLLYQLLNLNPYLVARNTDNSFDSGDTWTRMLERPAAELGGTPAPYAWNAILAYASSLGWGLRYGLTDDEYIQGENLFWYSTELIDPGFVRGGPVTLPWWIQFPPGEWQNWGSQASRV